jgi:hypothetical protein
MGNLTLGIAFSVIQYFGNINGRRWLYFLFIELLLKWQFTSHIRRFHSDALSISNNLWIIMVSRDLFKLFFGSDQQYRFAHGTKTHCVRGSSTSFNSFPILHWLTFRL